MKRHVAPRVRSARAQALFEFLPRDAGRGKVFQIDIHRQQVELAFALAIAVAGVEDHRHVAGLGLLVQPVQTLKDVAPRRLLILNQFPLVFPILLDWSPRRSQLFEAIPIQVAHHVVGVGFGHPGLD